GVAPLERPHPPGDRLEAQPRLVLGPHLDLRPGVGGPQLPPPPPQVFFHARRVGASAARGWLGRGTWRVNPRPTSHRHPVTGPTTMPHRSATYRMTFGPVHTPPSGGRSCNAASSASRCRAVSFGAAPLSLRRSVSPSGPAAFQRCRTSRTVTSDRPTRAATWAGVRGSSVRARSQTACHRTFSIGCRHARYLAR